MLYNYVSIVRVSLAFLVTMDQKESRALLARLVKYVILHRLLITLTMFYRKDTGGTSLINLWEYVSYRK